MIRVKSFKSLRGLSYFPLRLFLPIGKVTPSNGGLIACRAIRKVGSVPSGIYITFYFCNTFRVLVRITFIYSRSKLSPDFRQEYLYDYRYLLSSRHTLKCYALNSLTDEANLFYFLFRDRINRIDPTLL